MTGFHFYTQQEVQAFVTPREGETKLGQVIHASGANWKEDLLKSKARFCLLGLPEDIGVRANNGIPGTGTAWEPFLKSFLNIQETTCLSGADFFLMGHLAVPDGNKDSGKDIFSLREQTAAIDQLVFPLIREIIASGKIPIVIGGGHNNAFPLLKGASTALGKPLNAVNMDAHADFRTCEGRHSGNGFHYAYREGYLRKYAMLGLHEGYNNAEMISLLQNNPDFHLIFWDDLFLRKKWTWQEAMNQALDHVQNNPFGLELDLDSIAGVLSSAATPAGVSAREAMEYAYHFAQQEHAVYLHLPEAIAQRGDGLCDPLAGKLLSYLVQAFAKGVLERNSREQLA